MKKLSIQAIESLTASGHITICDDEVQESSQEYSFFDIKGFDHKKIRLAVYKLNHSNAWSIVFQQREGVWHKAGNFEKNDFKDIVGNKFSSSWRDDIGFQEGDITCPIEWLKGIIDYIEVDSLFIENFDRMISTYNHSETIDLLYYSHDIVSKYMKTVKREDILDNQSAMLLWSCIFLSNVEQNKENRTKIQNLIKFLPTEDIPFSKEQIFTIVTGDFQMEATSENLSSFVSNEFKNNCYRFFSECPVLLIQKFFKDFSINEYFESEEFTTHLKNRGLIANFFDTEGLLNYADEVLINNVISQYSKEVNSLKDFLAFFKLTNERALQDQERKGRIYNLNNGSRIFHTFLKNFENNSFEDNLKHVKNSSSWSSNDHENTPSKKYKEEIDILLSLNETIVDHTLNRDSLSLIDPEYTKYIIKGLQITNSRHFSLSLSSKIRKLFSNKEAFLILIEMIETNEIPYFPLHKSGIVFNSDYKDINEKLLLLADKLIYPTHKKDGFVKTLENLQNQFYNFDSLKGKMHVKDFHLLNLNLSNLFHNSNEEEKLEFIMYLNEHLNELFTTSMVREGFVLTDTAIEQLSNKFN